MDSTPAHGADGIVQPLQESTKKGRSWFLSGMEMTIVGAIEAVITYVLGATLRVAA